MEEEEEEGSFKANAVNEEDLERDRATPARVESVDHRTEEERTCPPTRAPYLDAARSGCRATCQARLQLQVERPTQDETPSVTTPAG